MQRWTDEDRNTALAHMSAWAGEMDLRRPSEPYMNCKELSAVLDGGLIDLGSHTRMDLEFPLHPAASRRDELQAIKALLDLVRGQGHCGLSYPFGRYSEETIDLAKDAGYSYACGTRLEAVRKGTNDYALPRMTVPNWSGDDFSRRLFGWA